MTKYYFGGGKGQPSNDPNNAGYPSTTGNRSGGGRGNDEPGGKK